MARKIQVRHTAEDHPMSKPMGVDGYKLTDWDGVTRRGHTGETLWRVGATVRPVGVGGEACGPGVLHAYCAPEVAVLGNPVHAEIPSPRLFRVRLADGAWQTDGLMRWTTSALIVEEELPLPALTTEEVVAWAICITPHESTREWAIRWLSGADWAAEAAGAAAAGAARAVTRAAAAAEAEARLMPALERARAILAGSLPAEQYGDLR